MGFFIPDFMAQPLHVIPVDLNNVHYIWMWCKKKKNFNCTSCKQLTVKWLMENLECDIETRILTRELVHCADWLIPVYTFGPCTPSSCLSLTFRLDFPVNPAICTGSEKTSVTGTVPPWLSSGDGGELVVDMKVWKKSNHTKRWREWFAWVMGKNAIW